MPKDVIAEVNTTIKANVKANEIRLTRIFDASVRAVWKAWNEPEQLAKWWGPRGYSITTHRRDLTVGGIWQYTMHGPGGADYPNKTRYLEIVDQTRLVYDHSGNDERYPLFRVTVDFSVVDGRTHMDMTMSFPTDEAAAESRAFIQQAGGETTWERLAEHLAGTSQRGIPAAG